MRHLIGKSKLLSVSLVWFACFTFSLYLSISLCLSPSSAAVICLSLSSSYSLLKSASLLLSPDLQNPRMHCKLSENWGGFEPVSLCLFKSVAKRPAL